jgi:CheY-like chemotaxis protein
VISTHRVLVVEDDLEIRESLMEILEENGYQPVGASNGYEGLAKLRTFEEPPCLILLDLMMPVMDGRMFRQEQLRRPEFASIPVVVLSAYRNVAEETKDMSVAAFLKKPMKLDDVLGVVRKHCPGHSMAS